MIDEVGISVIVPVYNVEKYLPDCLDSLLSQSFPDIEILAIDDCSPDRCGEILDQYASKDKRLKVFHLPENRHQGYGRNYGLDRAAGKYIYLIDSDDMLEPNALEVLYTVAEEDNLDGIMFDSKVIFENPGLEKKFLSYPAKLKGSYDGPIYSGSELYNRLIKNDDWTCYIQRQFWRREFLDRNRIRFPEGSEHEDEVFAFEAFLLAGRMRHISDELFIRRFREDSVMTKPSSPKNMYGYLVCFYEMTHFVKEHDIRSQYTDYNIGRIFFLFTELYQKFKQNSDLRQYFKRPEIWSLFEMYASASDSLTYFQTKYIEDCITVARAYKKVYLYGAGKVGSKVFQSLAGQKVNIDGFLVTSKEGNHKSLLGIPVIPIEDFSREEKDYIVIISTTMGYRRDIEGILDSRNIPHYYYKGN